MHVAKVTLSHSGECHIWLSRIFRTINNASFKSKSNARPPPGQESSSMSFGSGSCIWAVNRLDV